MHIFYEVQQSDNIFGASLIEMTLKSLNSVFSSVEENDTIQILDYKNLLTPAQFTFINNISPIRVYYDEPLSYIESKDQIINLSNKLLASSNALQVIKKALPYLISVVVNEPSYLCKKEECMANVHITLGQDRYWKSQKKVHINQYHAYQSRVNPDNTLIWMPLPTPFSLIDKQENRSPYFNVEQRWNEI